MDDSFLENVENWIWSLKLNFVKKWNICYILKMNEIDKI